MIRAVGGAHQQISRMIIAESLLLAALGTVIGLVAGLWLGYGLVGALNVSGFTTPYTVPYAGLLMAIVVGLPFGILAAWLPARQAARLNIVEALRYE